MGPIAFQHHGGYRDGKYLGKPSLVQFRNVRIKPLDDPRGVFASLPPWDRAGVRVLAPPLTSNSIGPESPATSLTPGPSPRRRGETGTPPEAWKNGRHSAGRPLPPIADRITWIPSDQAPATRSPLASDPPLSMCGIAGFVNRDGDVADREPAGPDGGDDRPSRPRRRWIYTARGQPDSGIVGCRSSTSTAARSRCPTRTAPSGLPITASFITTPS